MSKCEIFLFKLGLRRELKELIRTNRKLSVNEYANIRAYCAVLKQLEREEMYA